MIKVMTGMSAGLIGGLLCHDLIYVALQSLPIMMCGTLLIQLLLHMLVGCSAILNL